MSYGYVYLIKDCFTKKVYVGQSCRLKNQNSYFGSGKIILRIIKKRKHHLEKRILGFCDSKEELDEAEKICIEFFDARNFIYGYNIGEGGLGPRLFKEQNGMFNKRHSIKSKIKMQQTLRKTKCHAGKRNGRYVETSIELTNEILDLYINKQIGCRGIEKKIKIPFNRIKRILQENNIHLRNQSEAMKGKIPWNKNSSK